MTTTDQNELIPSVHIPDLETIWRLDREGLITVRQKDDLILLNYTQKCQYAAAWDDDTRICRGLILRLGYHYQGKPFIRQVVALPFPKFFNAGERDQWPSGEIVSATEKLDGSIGIIYHDGTSWQVATRGSFDSEQARWANNFLMRYNLDTLPTNLTLLVEIIYPANRIVVNYGDREDLVLLAVRNRITGDDWESETLHWFHHAWGFSVVPFLDFSNVDTALEWAKTLDANHEGCVLRMSDGSRWKIKSDVYRQIHKLLFNISKKSVLEMMQAGTFDTWRTAVPEEYSTDIDTWHKEAIHYIQAVRNEITLNLPTAPQATRKDFALWVRTRVPRFQPLYFKAFDGGDIEPLIFKQLIAEA